MIFEAFSAALIRDHLVPRADLRPYAVLSERPQWEELSADVRGQLIANGEAALVACWPPLPASLFLEFVRTGNRKVYETNSFPRRQILSSLVLAECAEGEGRFLDAILDAAWAICEESFWGISAHVSSSKGRGLPDTSEPVVDLFAAETAALVSWTVYLLGEQLSSLSPQIVPRMLREAKTRILDPCLERDDFWWMGILSSRGLNNWTPWICSNWLITALLLEEDAERRCAGVLKAVQCLDNYLRNHPADGGCDEGPGYWSRAGASAFDCAEILSWGTAGQVRLTELPLVRNMGGYICNVHIDEDRFVNFADAAPTASPNGALCVRYGLATENQSLVALGRYLLARGEASRPLGDLSHALAGLFATPAADGSATAPYLRDSWLPDTQVMTARCCGGSPAGFFVAAKGGHNAESHNHNDVGNVVVYCDGQPVLVDAGVGTYCERTFSSRRYEIWTMQSAYHNLPVIDGIQQFPGRDAAASRVSYRCDETRAELALDLAPAYPVEAGIVSWRRRITLARREWVEIEDAYSFHRAPGTLAWSFVTACEPVLGDVGIELLAPRSQGGDSPRSVCGRLIVSHTEATPAIEPITLDDARLEGSWPGGLWRILYSAGAPQTVGTAVFRLYRPGDR